MTLIVLVVVLIPPMALHVTRNTTVTTKQKTMIFLLPGYFC
ncbi:MAG TPA: hypothetical protein VHA33_26425 [Candidatus Angelobacter sp.]|nr:hypothetical protein [Candidatus Angelobacter sp.]